MKREGIDFSETEKYINISDEEIKEKYIIKGEVNWKTIQGAKKVSDLPTEYEEQRRLVAWLRENKIPCQASGNGYSLNTQDNIKYIAKLKASGMSVGYPDLDVFIGNGVSLHIEMKRIKGGIVSEAQERWINWLNNNGYYAKVCYGCDDAKKWIKSFLKK